MKVKTDKFKIDELFKPFVNLNNNQNKQQNHNNENKQSFQDLLDEIMNNSKE
jgi:hypothetical protein